MESFDKHRQHIKNQRHHFAYKGPYRQSYGFSVVMYWCESWIIRKAESQRIDALELWCWRRLFESPLDCKEIKAVNHKRNQLWLFIGRTDTEAESPILWPPDAKSLLVRKDPNAGKDWGRKRRGLPEDEVVGWHYQLSGYESEKIQKD